MTSANTGHFLYFLISLRDGKMQIESNRGRISQKSEPNMECVTHKGVHRMRVNKKENLTIDFSEIYCH